MNPIAAIAVTVFFVWLFIDFIKTEKHPPNKDQDNIPDDSVDFWHK